MWLTQVMAVISIIERVMPLVEKILPGHGQGAQKREIVIENAKAAGEALLPGVNMQDPAIKAAMDAKLAADVALANLLQAHAERAVPPAVTDQPGMNGPIGR